MAEMMPQLLIQNISASICCNILLAWIWLESAALPPRPVFCGYSDNLSGVRTVAEFKGVCGKEKVLDSVSS